MEGDISGHSAFLLLGFSVVAPVKAMRLSAAATMNRLIWTFKAVKVGQAESTTRGAFGGPPEMLLKA